MATLTVQQIARSAASLIPTYAPAAAGGDGFANDGQRTFFHMKNSGTSKTVTFVSQKVLDALAVADLAVTLAATTGDVMVGPFPAEIYNDANGLVQVTYSSETGVTVAAVRL